MKNLFSDSKFVSFEPVQEKYVHKIIFYLNVEMPTGADNILVKI